MPCARTMRLDEFDYELPEALIAKRPLADRNQARLLVIERGSAPYAPLTHSKIADLATHLRAGDLLVFNDTRVIPSRLYGTKPSGGAVEVFLTRKLAAKRYQAMLRASKKTKVGTRINIAPDFDVDIESDEGGGFYIVQLRCNDETFSLEQHGHIPLPPYIDREDDASDRTSYQTMFATHAGSSAAPTAGLHFTPELVRSLAQHGVQSTRLTLHVGPGTFLPVREDAADDITKHKMHSEWFELGHEAAELINHTRAQGGRVIAVGTTSVRTLETVMRNEGRVAASSGETDIFIFPGQEFKAVDGMVTNFHLPRSTLLMLVSAFVGRDRMLAAYRAAITEGYRFFSYGDACLLLPAGDKAPPA